MRLVDANVLIYAVNEASPQHETAREWLDAAIAEGGELGLSWTVILAFLRLMTHPAVFATPLGVGQAIATIRAWRDQPAVRVVEPTSRHLDVLAGLLAESGTAANLVSDAHLAALAIEHDATLVTFDADFNRFRGLRVERPGA